LIKSNAFNWDLRVYYEDTDAGGVVYHSNYLKFMERARTERIRSLGYELNHLAEEHDLLFVVRAMQIDFKKPAKFNDALWVTADFVGIRPASIVFGQVVGRGEAEVLCVAEVKVAAISAQSFKPKAVPEFLLNELSNASLTPPEKSKN
jgi:acyl-CoA thioester hydrolase